MYHTVFSPKTDMVMWFDLNALENFWEKLDYMAKDGNAGKEDCGLKQLEVGIRTLFNVERLFLWVLVIVTLMYHLLLLLESLFFL